MRETNLDCCVVRDLLPSYLEELTETETSAMVREHIEHCAACRQLEEDMDSCGCTSEKIRCLKSL